MSDEADLSQQFTTLLAQHGFASVRALINDTTLHLNGEIRLEPDASLLNLFLVNTLLPMHPKLKYFSLKRIRFIHPSRDDSASSPDEAQHKLSVSDHELVEMFDPLPVLKQKVSLLADHMRAAHHAVVYTGAGISTAAKIPDFRGPNGVWTRRDRNQPAPKCYIFCEKSSPPLTGISMEAAMPTFTHRCLAKMQDEQKLAFLVSQNVDGLHRRSGVRADMIAELHGNCYLEKCASCHKEFLRDYDVCRRKGPFFQGQTDELSQSGISHITGRRCDHCQGMLRDSIIHFSENLPKRDLQLAWEHSAKADVALCIGTSLRVSPACDLPQRGRGAMFIVNLQCTAKDEYALRSGGVLIHGRCDLVMQLLMEELGIADAVQLLNDEHAEIERALTEIGAVTEAAASCSSAYTAASEQSAAMEPSGSVLDDLVVVPTHLHIGNTCSLVDANGAANPSGIDVNQFDWTLFVSDSPDSISGNHCGSFIESVQVDLHPTFHPRQITLKQAPFQLRRLGWGEFDIRLKINFKAVTGILEPFEVVHSLCLAGRGAMTKVEVPLPKPSTSLLQGIQGFDRLQKLRSVQTRVTRCDGTSFVEEPGSSSSSVASSSLHDSLVSHDSNWIDCASRDA